MDNQKVKLGITQGDPSGVGMELILRVFAEQYIYKYCIPVVYGNTKTFIAWKKHLDLQLNLQDGLFHLSLKQKELRRNCFPCLIR